MLPSLNIRTRNRADSATNIHTMALADSLPNRRAVLPPRKRQNFSTMFIVFGFAVVGAESEDFIRACTTECASDFQRIYFDLIDRVTYTILVTDNVGLLILNSDEKAAPTRI